jgi:hypothetical protein
MKRLIWSAATVIALVGAGIAVAHDGNSKSVARTSATFSAGSPTNVRSSTCTGSDGKTYVTTNARYTGASSSSDGALNGNATFDVQSLINQTDGIGTVQGFVRIDGTGGHTVAQIDAVYSNGHVAGIVEGHGSASWNRLVANMSADFAANSGFGNGKLGGGTAGGDAAELTSGGCRPPKPPKPETIEVHGTVTNVSGTSISVAGVTCNVPSNLSSQVVASIHMNDRVELKCTSSGGTNTLVRVESRHHGDH